jgi:hypothetical protein
VSIKRAGKAFQHNLDNVSKPLSLYVDAHGTGTVGNDERPAIP